MQVLGEINENMVALGFTNLGEDTTMADVILVASLRRRQHGSAAGSILPTTPTTTDGAIRLLIRIRPEHSCL